jgi:hypothetical protein
VAKAQAKTVAAAAKRCTELPDFGPTSAAAVNAAALSTSHAEYLFGPDLDAAVVRKANDKDGARCQAVVTRAAARLLVARLKAFNTCAAAGLKDGTITDAAGLDACRESDPRGGLAKTVASLAKGIAKKCASLDVAAKFPGVCADRTAETLGGCLAPQIDCAVCTAVKGADGLTGTCHRFADGVATRFCGRKAASTKSVARQWNEQLLAAIRLDFPRPPVHARNLFHFSVAVWDAWAAYDSVADGYLSSERHQSQDPEGDRATAISYAAYRLLVHRFQRSPNVATSVAAFDAHLLGLGYDKSFTSTSGDAPAAVGNRIAAAVIAHGLADGCNEAVDYDDPTYTPLNDPLIVKLIGAPMLDDPNHWQPLALDVMISQNGIPIPGKVQKFVCPQWASVLPFAVDFNAVLPGPPPRLHDPVTDGAFKQQAVDLIRLASYLTPDDPTLMDISPASYGNNPLGSDGGTGYPVNPVTGQPYTPQLVKRGDFGRVIAEYWADGPTSETPPGHWNVLANNVADSPGFEKRFGGSGPVLGDLEWDVKTYFALNGAEHDAAIGCWGTKRVYDSVRPISMIRYMGGLGQSSDQNEPHQTFNGDGLPLVPGLVEVITEESSAAGERHEDLSANVGSIAILSWPGVASSSPTATPAGVKWVLAAAWVPYQRSTFVTPAFAGYTSGHSTYSRSAAEVLTRLTGSPFFPGGLAEYVIPQDHFLQFERGPSTDVVLQWAKYYDAADQAGQSRRWGGIHIVADDYAGRIMGSTIGNDAFDKALTYFDGTARP